MVIVAAALLHAAGTCYEKPIMSFSASARRSRLLWCGITDSWQMRLVSQNKDFEVSRSDLLPNAAEVTEVAVVCHYIILACAQSGIVSGFPGGF